MLNVLLGIFILLPVFARAETLNILDQECMAKETKVCLTRMLVTGGKNDCPPGKFPTYNYPGIPSECKDISVLHNDYNAGPNIDLSKVLDTLGRCERIVQASGMCVKSVNVPTATQIENFNNNLIKALELAYPKAAAPSANTPPAKTEGTNKPK